MQSPERWRVTTALLLTGAAWIVTIRAAHQMSGGMAMPGGWTMSMVWSGMGGPDVEGAAVFLMMWTTMMVAMMLPSVMPAVLLHGRMLGVRVERGENANGSQAALLAGYFSVWIGFGLLAYAIGTTVSSLAMRYAAFSVLIPAAVGVSLVAAGVYELTPWKESCLRHCRSPLDFFAQHEIRSAADSLRLGLHHGSYCAGCCWGLMTMQLVLGVMSLPVMAAVALVIFLEKQWVHGEAVAAAMGLIAVTGGTLFLLSAFVR